MTAYRAILPKREFEYLFSICTLVTNWAEYELMKASFENCDFCHEVEYLVADNSKKNEFDAYQAIRHFLNQSKGKYVIVVHQDVRCVDNKSQLLNLIDNLNQKNENWAIVGNAGAKGYHQEIMYINTNGKMEMTQNLPCEVNSLDENFLLFDAEKRMTISADLAGFHCYGTDLCAIAKHLGYSCFVIPFMVNHLSSGNLKDMELYKQPFIEKYALKLEGSYVQTTCTKFYLSNSRAKNVMYNKGVLFFFIKFWQRLKYNWVLITKGNQYKKTVVLKKP